MALGLEDIHHISAVSTGSRHQKYELEDGGKVECHSDKHLKDEGKKHEDPVKLVHSTPRHVFYSDLAIYGVHECEEEEVD